MGRKDIDNDFVEWEHTRKEHIEAMRKNPDYRFVMQVASFTNERLDKYWNGPTGSATGAGIQTNMDFGPGEDKDLVVPAQIIKDFEIQSKWSALIEVKKMMQADNAVWESTEENKENIVSTYRKDICRYIQQAYTLKKIAITAYARENDDVKNFITQASLQDYVNFHLSRGGTTNTISSLTGSLIQTKDNWKNPSTNAMSNPDGKYALWNSATSYLASEYEKGFEGVLNDNNIDMMNRFISNMYGDNKWYELPLPFEFVETAPYFGYAQKKIEETRRLVNTYKKRQLQKRAHRWMMSTPWATPQIYYTPMILGHMEEAHIVLQNKYSHLKKHTIDDIIRDDKARMFFAKFVSLLIRKSDIIASKRYHLDKSFRRINMEIGRVFRVFRDIKIKRRHTPVCKKDELSEMLTTLLEYDSVEQYWNEIIRNNMTPEQLSDYNSTRDSPIADFLTLLLVIRSRGMVSPDALQMLRTYYYRVIVAEIDPPAPPKFQRFQTLKKYIETQNYDLLFKQKFDELKSLFEN